MNRDLLVIFNHFELRMLHANSLAPLPRLPENDQPLLRENHFLDIVRIEPSQRKRLAERVRFALFQRRFENLLAPAKSKQARLCNLTAKANRMLTFLARK